MNKLLIYRYFTLFCTVIYQSGCVDIIDFSINENPDQVVIYGAITTEPGPYEVRITRAIDFYSTSSNPAITDAQVFISSNEGEVERLTYESSGTYLSNPNGIRGESGKSYALTVILNNGEIYQSSRQTIVPSPLIDSIYYEYREDDIRSGELITGIEKYIEVQIDTKDDPDEENYYRWTWNGTFRYRTFPELFKISDDDGNRVISPLPCSSPPCSCCNCWASEANNDIVIKTDRLINGNNIKNQIVAKIPITARTFEDKFHIQVTQESLSPEAYQFWKLIEDQSLSATLFATPPAQIKSNLININRTDELVWGFFSASDVSMKTLAISRTQLPIQVPVETDSLTEDCRNAYPNATNQAPDFW